MSQNSDSTSTEKQFHSKLVQKALRVIVPALILPAITALIGGHLFPKLYPTGEIFAVILILFISGLLISYLFDWFLTKQIINPLQEITDTLEQTSLGNFQRKANIRRRDEIGYLAFATNQVGDRLSERYHFLEDQLITRNKFIKTAAKIGETTTTVIDIDTIIQQAVSLIAENFSHYHTAIYLIDQQKSLASLRAIHGRASTNPVCQGYTLPADGESIIGWTVKYNQTRIAIDVQRDPLYRPFPGLPDAKSEIAIPISVPGMILGVLDIQDVNYDAFGEEEISTLQLIANQLAATIQIRFPAGIGAVDPATTETLYQASHAITMAQSVEDIFQQLAITFKKLPYAVALYVETENVFQNQLLTGPGGMVIQKESLETLPLTPQSIQESLPGIFPILLSDPKQREGLPKPLIELGQKINYKFLTLYPIIARQKLAGLFFLGATKQENLSLDELQAFTHLVEITSTALEKVFALQSISEHLAELHTLRAVSQTISTETNLAKLFEAIHQQVIQVMGTVNFLIALYDEAASTIEIPYMEEDGKIVSVPPFPLGEGLTSIIIRSRQPLLLVEDTVNRSRALGAIITGDRPALSWLGVPMILGDNIIGAIVIQDLENEHGFDEEDMNLLSALASQVAVAINNTRLIQNSQARAERDRQLLAITQKIRYAVDVNSVVTTTAQELAKALNIRRAQIALSIEPLSEKKNGDDPKKDPA